MKVTITKTIGEAVSTTSVEGDFEEVQTILQDLGFISVIGEYCCEELDYLPKMELLADSIAPASINVNGVEIDGEELKARIKKAVEEELKKFHRVDCGCC